MGINMIHDTPTLSSRDIAEYISGFVDGEGCFSVSFSKRQRFNTGWEIKPSFSVSQNHDRARPLSLCKNILDVGLCGMV